MSSEEECQAVDLSRNIVPYSMGPLASSSRVESELSTSDSDSSEGTDTSDQTPHVTEEDTDSLPWCNCGHCTGMPEERENICCHQYGQMKRRFLDGQSCITQHPGYEANCLNQWVLEASLYEFVQDEGRLGDDEPLNQAFRYLAYRRLVRWIFGRLGKKNRRVLPACAVTKIRDKFPSDFYMGFHYPVY